MNRTASPGERLRPALRNAIEQQQLLAFVGIHDLFSASLAAVRFDALFLSGFGLAAGPGACPTSASSAGDTSPASPATSHQRALLP
jgi:2-methylisocitrate lyase-like PEP mutase family enzyme